VSTGGSARLFFKDEDGLATVGADKCQEGIDDDSLGKGGREWGMRIRMKDEKDSCSP